MFCLTQLDDRRFMTSACSDFAPLADSSRKYRNCLRPTRLHPPRCDAHLRLLAENHQKGDLITSSQPRHGSFFSTKNIQSLSSQHHSIFYSSFTSAQPISLSTLGAIVITDFFADCSANTALISLNSFHITSGEGEGLVGDSLEFEGVRRANLGLWEI
jgi:hypothetical protein